MCSFFLFVCLYFCVMFYAASCVLNNNNRCRLALAWWCRWACAVFNWTATPNRFDLSASLSYMNVARCWVQACVASVRVNRATSHATRSRLIMRPSPRRVRFALQCVYVSVTNCYTANEHNRCCTNEKWVRHVLNYTKKGFRRIFLTKCELSSQYYFTFVLNVVYCLKHTRNCLYCQISISNTMCTICMPISLELWIWTT